MIGIRLKRVREALGLSLRDLEAKIQGLVTAQAIGKYERNESMPGSTVLLALSRALEVSPEFLLSEQPIELTGVDFRKGPQAGVKEERAVEAAVLDQVERYLALEEFLPEAKSRWKLEIPLTAESIEGAEACAESLRTNWKLGIDPIPMMAELLEEKGVKVIALDLPESVSGSKAFVHRVGSENVPVIVVNGGHNGERQRFTLAHELAHLALDFVGLDAKEQEKAADRFAGAFLVAREMLTALIGHHRKEISMGELIGLKKIFKVSVASLVVRCNQLGLISKALYSRLWTQIRALGWNGPQSNEPHRLEPENPQRMERLCFRAIVEGAVSESKAAELMRMSVRELDRRLSAQGV